MYWKKPSNLVKVLRKKSEKTNKSFKKMTGYMTKKSFYF